MIPILFEHDETAFTTHGLGDLIDTLECKVKQTAEGEYEMSLRYPGDGELFSKLQINRLILVKANDYDQFQPFRIYSIEKNIDGSVTVNCQHLSYDLASYPVKMFKNQIDPYSAVSKINENIVNINPLNAQATCPFQISGYVIPAFSDANSYKRGDLVVHSEYTWQCIEDVFENEGWNNDKWSVLNKFSVESSKSVREALIDGDDSVLGLYGGDIKFDRYNVSILKSAGSDNGVTLEYGVDLVDMTQEQNISETTTGVFPYWKGNIRGTVETSDYQIYTGSRFEDGYTYYERHVSYREITAAEREAHYDYTKTYYVYSGENYRAVAIGDLNFKAGTVYYKVNTADYTATTDASPVQNKHYYVLGTDNVYRMMSNADLAFQSDVEYYERLANGTYIKTKDTEYNSQKLYYIWESDESSAPAVEPGEEPGGEEPIVEPGGDSSDDNEEPLVEPGGDEEPTDNSGESDELIENEVVSAAAVNDSSQEANGTWIQVDTVNLAFKSDVTYFERKATGYTRVPDNEQFNSSTEYFVATSNLGAYMAVQTSDLDFHPDKTYYLENSVSYSATTDTSLQSNKTYFVMDTYTDQEKIVYGDIQYADGYTQLPSDSQRIEPLDLSEFFEAETDTALKNITAEVLNKKARQWMLANDVGIPAIDLTVSYAKLGQNVRLFDAITVRFVKLGIDTKAKVSSYTYDVLAETCKEIEVTNAKASSAWSGLEDASRLKKGLLPPSRIGKKSITSEHIGTGEIMGSNIASGGVGTTQLAENAATTSKIADDAITYNKILDGSITTKKIEDGAVTGVKVIDQAISLKKLDKDLQVLVTDILSCFQLFAERATVNRYVDSPGYYGDIYLIKVGSGYYSMGLHSHEMHVDNEGNVWTEEADWTGQPHKVKVKAVFGA